MYTVHWWCKHVTNFYISNSVWFRCVFICCVSIQKKKQCFPLKSEKEEIAKKNRRFADSEFVKTWIRYQICKQPQPPPGSLKLQVVRAEVSLLIQLLFTKTWIFIGCGLMLWWVQCTKVLKQRCVTSIGNIDKAMWVFNCLGRPGRLVKISRIHFFHFVLNEGLNECRHVRQIDNQIKSSMKLPNFY